MMRLDSLVLDGFVLLLLVMDTVSFHSFFGEKVKMCLLLLILVCSSSLTADISS